MKTKKRIYMLSDSPLCNTGYATITRNLLNGLSDEYECFVQAHNYLGQPLKNISLLDGTPLNFTIFGNGIQPYSQELLEPRIKELDADYFIILLDTFMTYPWIFNKNFSPAKSIFYFPSDGGGGLPLGCEEVLRKMNHSVAMAKFGQQQVKEKHGINAHYIPHAVDTDLFYPVSEEEKEKIKQELVVRTLDGRLVKGGLAGKFVVGEVARNQGRKMLDLGLKAFRDFAKDKPDVCLYLHTDPMDAAQVFNMVELIRRLQIENRVFFSPMTFYQNFEYKDMPKVYNAMDIFFLSTSGEGFGIPTLEAMSCGVPCAVTDYTTTQELLIENGQCGLPIPIYGTLTGGWTVERGLMNIEEATKCLNELYSNKEMRENFGKIGRQKAVNFYSWKVVLDSWRNFLRSI